MYSEKLEKLIELALADGILTDKEKEILLRTAKAEGVDPDELEMVLEGRLYERTDKAENQATPAKGSAKQETVYQEKKTENQTTPQTNKHGEVKKCPACAAMLQTFQTRCDYCGHEFRNVEASYNITKFFEKLNEVESGRKEVFDSNNFSLGTVILWLFFWPFLLAFKLIQFSLNSSKPTRWSTTDSRKEEMISNFPIPMSQEDILEFLALAASKIESIDFVDMFSENGKYRNTWNNIWIKKMEHIYVKASFSMRGENTHEEVKRIVDNAKAQVKINNNRRKYMAAIAILLFCIFCFFFLAS
jgi:hypothetical protein